MVPVGTVISTMRVKAFRKSLLVLAGPVLVASSVLVGCSSTENDASPEPFCNDVALADAAGAEGGQITEDDAYSNLPMAELISPAELIVAGEVASRNEGIRVRDSNGVEDPFVYTRVTVEVSGSFKGEPGDTVDLLMTQSVENKPFVRPGLQIPDVGQAGLWFLAPGNPDYDLPEYSILGTGGAILFDSDCLVIASDGDARAHEEAQALATREAVLEHLADLTNAEQE